MTDPAPIVDGIDWSRWTPTERATLCFVRRDGEVLLIRKLRGLGAGKMNGPGGRIDPGETAQACAVRETQEETGVTPLGLRPGGELFFEFKDGYKLHVAVFDALGCTGEARPSHEADPAWTRLEAIPYHEMWADDVYWLPLLLAGRAFRGYFTFDGDRMLSYRVVCPETGMLLKDGVTS